MLLYIIRVTLLLPTQLSFLEEELFSASRKLQLLSMRGGELDSPNGVAVKSQFIAKDWIGGPAIWRGLGKTHEKKRLLVKILPIIRPS